VLEFIFRGSGDYLDHIRSRFALRGGFHATANRSTRLRSLEIAEKGELWLVKEKRKKLKTKIFGSSNGIHSSSKMSQLAQTARNLYCGFKCRKCVPVYAGETANRLDALSFSPAAKRHTY